MSRLHLRSVRELMELHVEALFRHDAEGRLLTVNEPDGAPAPRFFLGRTTEGSVFRFRHDVGEEMKSELEAAVAHEHPENHLHESPTGTLRYLELLARGSPVQRTWLGPAFCFPRELPENAGAVLVTHENAHLLHPFLEAWIPDVLVCHPMLMLVVEERAVSVCGTVRRTSTAHEAGVETAPEYRGRGYAARVVTSWARSVRDVDRVPLYSTSWQNEASRGLARTIGLTQFGSDLHIT